MRRSRVRFPPWAPDNTTFNSIAQLEDAIDLRAAHWNNDPKPFIWKKTADEILAKVRRGRSTLTHQINSATDH